MSIDLKKLPDSPCVGICTTLFDDVCQGCGRTVQEVAQWVFFNEEEKRVVWQRIIAEGSAQCLRKNTLDNQK